VLSPENDGKRAFLKIFNSTTGTEFTTTKLFLNGKLVNKIVIEPLSWNYIAISFEKDSLSEHYPIYLNSARGQIEIYSGVKVDNVASFTELNPIKQDLITYDPWSNVSDNIDNEENVIDESWQYWSASTTWAEILAEKSQEITLLSLDGKEIFDTYVGLSFGIVNDNSVIDVTHDSIVIINDITWDEYLV
jgi:hypothetical protein